MIRNRNEKNSPQLRSNPGSKPGRTSEDKWIPASCEGSCVDGPCIVRVHVVNGVAVGIEPNTQNSDFETLAKNRGRLCPKPYGLIQKLYNPDRIQGPMKRTNPEKGRGVDPQWVHITWDEALDILTEKLKRIQQTDTKKLAHGIGVAGIHSAHGYFSFFRSFGPTQELLAGETAKCEMNEHAWSNRIHGGQQCEPDLDYCNYLILLGSNPGASGGATEGGHLADARGRGMKTVVVDPVLSVTAAKADEWLPIRPGTDTAFLLAMIHVMLHELNVYDAEFLKQMTNAPYLVKPDGYFEKDEASNKVLVWDPVDGKAKAYDDATIRDFALEGSYQVGGLECRPAFEVLKNHVKQYTPEWAARITDLGVDTIRRITKEFVESAKIGSTITIGGMNLPHRPAAVKFGKGVTGAMSAYQSVLANHILAALIGSLEVPGGHMGGHTFGSGKWRYGILYNLGPFHAGIVPGDDGMTKVHHRPVIYPPVTYGATESLAPFAEFSPWGINPRENPSDVGGKMHHLDWRNLVDPPEGLPVPDAPEVWVRFRLNPLISTGEPDIIAKAMKKIPFIVSFSYTEDEVTDYADLLLPEQLEFERYNLLFKIRSACGKKYFMIVLNQPVIEPTCDVRNVNEVFAELAERLEILDDFNRNLNAILLLTDAYKLDPGRRYSWEEIVDKQCKCYTNGAYGLDWFRANGALVKPVSVEDQYDVHAEMRARKLRYSIPYMEEVKRGGEELARTLDQAGIDWWTANEYVPLPIYVPTVLDSVSPEYDFYVLNCRMIMYSWGNNAGIPWMNELSKHVRGAWDVMMNRSAATARGIREGEKIWVESPVGKVKSQVKLCEGVRPDCVLISGMFGQWKMPLAKDTGRVSHSELTPIRYDWSDPVTGTMQGIAVKAKIYKA